MKRILHGIILAAVLGLATVIGTFLPGALSPVPDQSLAAGAKSEEDALAALKKLTPEQLQELSLRETDALKSNPLDKGALQNLSVLAGLQGNVAKSEKLALVLSDYGRRSVAAQLAAVQINLAGKDFDMAFDRLDGALRARPEFHDRLFPLLTSSLGDKAAQAALGTLLARDPPWRDAFIKHAIAQDPQASIAYVVLSAIRAAKADVKDTEKRLVIEKLIKGNHLDAAYFVWLDLLPPADLALVRNVFDGGFDTIPRQLYFDWHIPQRKNARMEVVSRPGSSQDRALSMDFLADSQGKEYVYQFLRLGPGAFTLDFEVLSEGLKTDSGLVWRVSCLGSPNVLGESPPVTSDGPWVKSQFSFAVPDADCATQLLKLENRGRAKLDKEISGRLMFDNVVVEKAGAAPEPADVQQP